MEKHRKDKDVSKSKKKHKKHKKNKKSKKYDAEGKEKVSSKKHKKHRKRHKSSDEYSSDANNDKDRDKGDTPILWNRQEPIKETPISSLNTKFTEIMKSNGHFVVANSPTTKFLSSQQQSKNGSSGCSSTKHSGVNKIPTDPKKLVEFITQSLDPNVPSMQIVSSESESDTVQDVDSPDVAVIEDDELNLEELMKQKALLQARLGGYAVSDTESENSKKTPMMLESKIEENKIVEKPKNKRGSSVNNDVILLDDSSNEISAKQSSPPRKRQRNSRSKSKERTHRASESVRDRGTSIRDSDKTAKTRRSDNDNRFKEDLRREIDRDKERNRSPKHQSASSPRSKHHGTSSLQKQPGASVASKLNTSTSRSGANSPISKSRTTIPQEWSKQYSATSSSYNRDRPVCVAPFHT